jgi:hypothetical protein
MFPREEIITRWFLITFWRLLLPVFFCIINLSLVSIFNTNSSINKISYYIFQLHGSAQNYKITPIITIMSCGNFHNMSRIYVIECTRDSNILVTHGYTQTMWHDAQIHKWDCSLVIHGAGVLLDLPGILMIYLPHSIHWCNCSRRKGMGPRSYLMSPRYW